MAFGAKIPRRLPPGAGTPTVKTPGIQPTTPPTALARQMVPRFTTPYPIQQSRPQYPQPQLLGMPSAQMPTMPQPAVQQVNPLPTVGTTPPALPGQTTSPMQQQNVQDSQPTVAQPGPQIGFGPAPIDTNMPQGINALPGLGQGMSYNQQQFQNLQGPQIGFGPVQPLGQPQIDPATGQVIGFDNPGQTVQAQQMAGPQIGFGPAPLGPAPL